MIEIWKDIEGYAGMYQISNLGNVKSLKRVNRKSDKVIGQYLRGNTLKVSLTKDRKVKNISIHRLVADAFLENPDGNPQVHHIDGNMTNNNVENLQWAKQKKHKAK